MEFLGNKKNHNRKFISQSVRSTKGKKKLKKGFGNGKVGPQKSYRMEQRLKKIRQKQITKTIQYKRAEELWKLEFGLKIPA